jgi:formate/nitrite transporter FocA (FNT family)
MASDKTLDLGKAEADVSASRLTVRKVVAIAWLAIMLGFAMQALILAVRTSAGGVVPMPRFLTELVQGISWSLLVCLGVSAGTVLVKLRAVLAGLLAAICTPFAIGLANAGQKAMATLLGAAGQPAALPLLLITIIKAVEYGLLGWVLGRMVERRVRRPTPFVLAGAGTGAVFGGAITALTWQAIAATGAVPELPRILGVSVNEILFPIGCAMVIFFGQSIRLPGM